MAALAELSNRILYTPAWEAFNFLCFMAGLAGIFALLFGFASTRRRRMLAWSGVGLLLLSIATSMLLEEIVPVWPTLAEARRLPFALSFAGFALFVVVFLYSGYRLVQDGLFRNITLLARPGPHRGEAVQGLRPGLLWFAGSALLFMVSLLGYHGLDVIMGRTP